MKLNIIFKLIALLIFINYSGLILEAQEISEDIEKALNETGAKMVKATLAGEYLSLPDYFTKDAVVMPDFKPAIKGMEALREQYEMDMNNGMKHHSFTGNIEKRWQRGNEIYERGTFGMAVSSKYSTKQIAFVGSYFQIWEHQSDGSYKISFTIWNLDFNPYESQ